MKNYAYLRAIAASFLGLVLAVSLKASPKDIKRSFPAKTGAEIAGIQHKMAELKPLATFHVEGHPDWMAVADGGVWVTSSSANHVVWLDARTNQPGSIIQVSKPCSGLALGFGSLWIPSCGSHALVRADARTGKVEATIETGPADSEGGIATGAGSVWLVTSDASDLVRIDPIKNVVIAHIQLPPGSFNPVFASGSVWISSNQQGTLMRVDPSTNRVVSQTRVGPMPRFLTAGGGSVWVLNQGDGTIARVDANTGKRTAVIRAGIPGLGGEIAYGGGAVWATVFEFPITRIDASSGAVTGQWRGPGGDSIRFGHGSVWLSSLMGGVVWRIPPPAR